MVIPSSNPPPPPPWLTDECRCRRDHVGSGHPEDAAANHECRQDLYARVVHHEGNRDAKNDRGVAVLQYIPLYPRPGAVVDKAVGARDPQQKKDLLEGLAILMNKVNENDGGPGARTGRNLPLDPLKPMNH
ncbi:hypothetical protein GWK47_025309 [Chionoecetes opilio]|uniref:Uncharacterized protein n=1 Tax=Chionoecetes opilio TaxID=41210 RepID=A0A8J5CIU3_CHIOP|nr:hypothetical protein GWK47_025309 [Chionoecetes opilio]